MKELGLYVHIPFCVQKCAYCDFVSFENKIQLAEQYVQALKKEISMQCEFLRKLGENEEIRVKTIYIGGGTPSYINSGLIVDVIKHLKMEFNIIKQDVKIVENGENKQNKKNKESIENKQIEQQVEITIEVNPGSVTRQKIEDYVLAGINRISIGLQSTHNELLGKLGRIHKYDRFLNTYELVREYGLNNVNVDLMLGIPDQTIDMLDDSLEKIIGLSPEHISVYSLIIEEGTKLEKMLQKKKIILPDEQDERKMYWLVSDKLQENGYIHYEISNFAKSGYESKHNMDCWSQKEYIGFGVSAHSYINNQRYSNTNILEEYMKNPRRSWKLYYK